MLQQTAAMKTCSHPISNCPNLTCQATWTELLPTNVEPMVDEEKEAICTDHHEPSVLLTEVEWQVLAPEREHRDPHEPLRLCTN